MSLEADQASALVGDLEVFAGVHDQRPHGGAVGADVGVVSAGGRFAVDGEGGVNTDYLAYSGRPIGTPSLLTLTTGGFAAAGALTTDNSDILFSGLFPNGVMVRSKAYAQKGEQTPKGI